MNFRAYVQEMWLMHKDEIEYWEKRVPNYDAKEYFARLRWWLRREYRLAKGRILKDVYND